jgi:transcription elongation GreA/GreB family factor
LRCIAEAGVAIFQRRGETPVSRAFVREPDGDAVTDDQPERPISPHANYVTETGLAKLTAALAACEAERDALKAEADLAHASHLAQLERDGRYYEARLQSALLVDAARQPHDRAAFGAWVTVADEDGEQATYRIVGEDEAEPGEGLISYVSPLARALEGAAVGELVTWRRPAGDLELEVVEIRYK